MIERLTNRNESGIAYAKIPTNPSNMINVGECYTGRIIDRIAAYEDSELSPEQVQEIKRSDVSKEQCTIEQHDEIHRLRDELKRYEQAGKDGRLMVLPEGFKELCKAQGDHIYHLMVDGEVTKSILRYVVFGCYRDIHLIFGDGEPDEWLVPFSTFGKTVFLTREAAEKALGGAEG